MKPARSFTLVEILVVVSIVLVLAAIALPQLIRSRMTAIESTAVSNLRGLANALAMFRSANNRYPAQWQLEVYTNADPDYGPALFNADLGAGFTAQGYFYRYEPAAGAAPLAYAIAARPAIANLSGSRTFWVNETAEIFHCLGISAAQDPPVSVAAISEAPAACP